MDGDTSYDGNISLHWYIALSAEMSDMKWKWKCYVWRRWKRDCCGRRHWNIRNTEQEGEYLCWSVFV